MCSPMFAIRVNSAQAISPSWRAGIGDPAKRNIRTKTLTYRAQTFIRICRMGMKQMRMNVWARYVNVFVLMFLFAGSPIPARQEGLIACALFTLIANIGLHIFAVRSGNYRLVSYLLLG